ncbi:hypothetical protein F3K43_09845 [Streptomyces sp. LBUM 1476]|nr:hypothetical protein [Streptomyces sp. LBUM 1476]
MSTAGALLVAPHLEDPASVLAALLPTWAGAYLAWSAYRADRVEAAVALSPPRRPTGWPTLYGDSGRPRPRYGAWPTRIRCPSPGRAPTATWPRPRTRSGSPAGTMRSPASSHGASRPGGCWFWASRGRARPSCW